MEITNNQWETVHGGLSSPGYTSTSPTTAVSLSSQRIGFQHQHSASKWSSTHRQWLRRGACPLMRLMPLSSRRSSCLVTTPHSSSSFRSGTYLSCARQKGARTPDSCSVQQHTMSKAQRELATLFPWSGRPEQSLLVLAPTCQDLTSLLAGKKWKRWHLSAWLWCWQSQSEPFPSKSLPRSFAGHSRAKLPSCFKHHGYPRGLVVQPSKFDDFCCDGSKKFILTEAKARIVHVAGMSCLTDHAISSHPFTFSGLFWTLLLSRLAPDYFNQFLSFSTLRSFPPSGKFLAIRRAL